MLHFFSFYYLFLNINPNNTSLAVYTNLTSFIKLINNFFYQNQFNQFLQVFNPSAQEPNPTRSSHSISFLNLINGRHNFQLRKPNKPFNRFQKIIRNPQPPLPAQPDQLCQYRSFTKIIHRPIILLPIHIQYLVINKNNI